MKHIAAILSIVLTTAVAPAAQASSAQLNVPPQSDTSESSIDLGIQTLSSPTLEMNGLDPVGIALGSAEAETASGQLDLTPVKLEGERKQKNPWVAAGLNFFFPGAGYIYTGERRALGFGFLAGAIGLTLVEQSDAVPFLDPGLRESNPQLFGMMFASIFVMNTAFAIDAYRETRARGEGAAASQSPRRRWAVAPTALDGGEQRAAYGLALSARY